MQVVRRQSSATPHRPKLDVRERPLPFPGYLQFRDDAKNSERDFYVRLQRGVAHCAASPESGLWRLHWELEEG
jgi:hypothetical protein